MPHRKYKPEEIVTTLRQGNALLSQGRSVADVVHSIGVAKFIYIRLRKEFDGLKERPKKTQTSPTRSIVRRRPR
jgi:hypothetical protein